MIKKTTLIVSLLVLLHTSAFSNCIDDICFPSEDIVAGENLTLSGYGLLEYLKFDMYVAAFYLPKDSIHVEKPLSVDISKKLILHYKRNIKVSWMNKAAENVIQKNPNVDYEAIARRVEAIGNAYQKVQKNDRYALAYNAKNKETTLYLNDQKVISIPGGDFASAYLGIWVGDYPANSNLRDQLLRLSDNVNL